MAEQLRQDAELGSHLRGWLDRLLSEFHERIRTSEQHAAERPF